MAKPYAAEMGKLADTFAWAVAADIEPLRKAVRTAGFSSLLAIGSGGSLTAAHALAGLHQRFTRRIAAVATPVDAVAEPLEASVAPWSLSAGGGNVDILAAAKALIAREPRQVAVLCGREDSPLAELCRRHAFVDLLIYPPPAGKDGFLATNSLLGFTALLTRAYAAEFGGEADWSAAVESDPIVAVPRLSLDRGLACRDGGPLGSSDDPRSPWSLDSDRRDRPRVEVHRSRARQSSVGRLPQLRSRQAPLARQTR